MAQKTAEDIVRSRYPNAFAARRPRVSFAMPEVWEIIPFKELGHDPLGTGSTEHEAWADAAEKIQKETESSPPPAV